jgi:RecA-family ATPase
VYKRQPLACLEDRIEVVSLREDDRDVDAVLEGILERKEQPDVVIFDAFYMFVMQGMDENSNADIAAMVRKFRRFASKSGAASVLVHHTSKGSQAGKEAIDVGAGAGALARAVDTYISIRKHAEDDTFRVDYNLRSSKEYPPHAIGWNYPRYREVSVEDIDELDRPGKKKPSDG